MERARHYRKAVVVALFLCMVIVLFAVVWRGGTPQEQEAPPGRATISIDVSKKVVEVNQRMFGTAMSEARSGRQGRDDLNSPLLRQLFNELAPQFMTIQNTSGGLPFYPEETGEYSKRITLEEILERMNFRSDPVGKTVYERIKNESALRQPIQYNIDDLLQYFETLDVKPGIAIRVPTFFTSLGSSDVAKMKLALDPNTGADLVRYLNDPSTTPLGKLRAQNGHPAPYAVTYFVLGNEMWNNHIDHGLPIEAITTQHHAFARAMKEADRAIKIGFNLTDDAYPHELFKPDFLRSIEKPLGFNDKILFLIKDDIDFVTYHIYSDMGIAQEGAQTLDLDPRQWKFLMAQAYLKEKYGSFKRHREIIAPYASSAEIINDEYSGPLANLGGALFAIDHVLYLLKNGYDSYASYWNSGLFEPFTYFGLLKVPENPLSSGYVRRPAFYALKLLNRHFGGTIVDTHVESSTFEMEKTTSEHLNWPQEQIPSVNAVAALYGNSLSLITVNRETNRSIEAEILLKNFLPRRVTRHTLTGPSLNSRNEDEPNTVMIRESELEDISMTPFRCTLERHSVTLFEFRR